MPNSIKFIIPMLPPSVNSLYNVIFSMKQIQLKPEVRLWKTQASFYVPNWRSETAGYFYFNADIYMRTLHKNGKVKRHDLQNLEKCLIDTVCEKLGFGDEFIFAKRTRKIESDKERVEVEIGVLPDTDVLDHTADKP